MSTPPLLYRYICPACGQPADFIARRVTGRDSGTGEYFEDEWMECCNCAANLTEKEVEAVNQHV